MLNGVVFNTANVFTRSQEENFHRNKYKCKESKLTVMADHACMCRGTDTLKPVVANSNTLSHYYH